MYHGIGELFLVLIILLQVITEVKDMLLRDKSAIIVVVNRLPLMILCEKMKSLRISNSQCICDLANRKINLKMKLYN